MFDADPLDDFDSDTIEDDDPAVDDTDDADLVDASMDADESETECDDHAQAPEEEREDWILTQARALADITRDAALAQRHVVRLLEWGNRLIDSARRNDGLLPATSYKFRRLLHDDKTPTLHYYAQCLKCTTLHSIPSVHLPDERRCTACAEVLTQLRPNGSAHRVKRTFVRVSLRDQLLRLLALPGWLDSCDAWPSRRAPEGVMADVHDGRLWAEHETTLRDEKGLALMLTIDWFQPWDATQYSVGLIFAVVLNLPRTARYRPENMLLVGVIPGPSEPKTVNPHVEAFVDELLEMQAMPLECEHRGRPRRVPVVLLGVTADIPALRKLCGFAGHSAERGCSKCMALFRPTNRGNRKRNIEDAEREHDPNDALYGKLDPAWTPRDIDAHRQAAQAYQESNRGARDRIVREQGLRWSQLLRLPHFNIVRQHTVDVMHTVFLGTVKRVRERWMAMLSEDVRTQLQAVVDRACVPSDVTRLTGKFLSMTTSLTADELRSFVLYFAPFLLARTLRDDRMRHFLLLAEAVHLIARPVVRREDIAAAHDRLRAYILGCDDTYDTQFATINTHLQIHLADIFLDFGPAPAFWCFPFERQYGRLGNQPSSSRHGWTEIEMANHLLRAAAASRAPNVDMDYGQLLGRRDTVRLLDEGSMIQFSSLRVHDLRAWHAAEFGPNQCVPSRCSLMAF